MTEMQITETSADGLKREYDVLVEAQEIDARMNERLKELSQTVRMKGFRPGKVPVDLLKKLHGDVVMNEILEKTVNETSQEALSEKNVRPATQPQIDVKEFGEGKGLEYSMAVEILPDIEIGDLSKLAVERPVVKVTDAEVDAFLARIAEQQKSFKTAAKTHKAKDGDAVVIDFTGYRDGEAFEGGAAEDYRLVLGSGQFIPGFEEQLIGVKAGDETKVQVSFPADYQAEDLAGKDVVFDVTVKEVQEPEAVAIDDSLAEKLGLSDLDELKEKAREQIEREFSGISRERVKRQLLDQLAESYDFDVPPGMVEEEFNHIWQQYESDLAREGKSIEDEEKSEDELKEEYHALAVRRVRLGLLFSEIGQANNIEVSQEELNRALSEQMRNFPGQEQQLISFYQQNPQAMAQLKGPIYEDKVVDFILELAQVTDKEVTREEIENEPEEEAPAQKEGKKEGKKEGETESKKKASAKSGKTSGGKAASKSGAAKAGGKKTTSQSGAAKAGGKTSGAKGTKAGSKKTAEN